MKLSVILSVVAVGFAATNHTGCEFKMVVDKVNSANVGWTAEVPTRFGNLDDVRQVCGTWTKKNPNYVHQNFTVFSTVADAIPAAYDARTAHANCTVISKVRDQSACGSCWAFGSTEAFEDSRCISTGEDVEFSVQDTAGCCKGFQCGFSQGCGGGQPNAALTWMTKQGVVTGGDYIDMTSKTGGCKPYSLKPCAHHVPPSTKYPACPTKEYSVTCETSCTDTASGKTYSTDKSKGAKVFRPDSVAAMQTAIMTTGPLAVAFTVYSDFPTYKSGVYKHTSGSELGGHAVEMVGWGTDATGGDYWIVKNSWNEQWGNGGFFWIARGSNECGIEDDVTGISF